MDGQYRFRWVDFGSQGSCFGYLTVVSLVCFIMSKQWLSANGVDVSTGFIDCWLLTLVSILVP